MLGFFVVSSLLGAETPFMASPNNRSSALQHLQGTVVVLDPGHGGGDPGTLGVGPTTEAENVLAIAWELKSMLERYGAKVIMTRQTEASPAVGTQFAGERNGQLAARCGNGQSERRSNLHLASQRLARQQQCSRNIGSLL